MIARCLSAGIEPTVAHAPSVTRVLSRLGRGRAELESTPGVPERLTSVANALCRPSSPRCQECPIARFCHYARVDAAKRAATPLALFTDLFSGAGGLSLGLEHNGFAPNLAIDHDPAALSTYFVNRPFLQTGQCILSDVDLVLATIDPPKTPMVVGGPPCQGFSNANQQPLENDRRNGLYRAFVRWVDRAQSTVVLFENVVGILKSRAEIERSFADIGFVIRPFRVNAADYGIPQFRDRIFWFGVRSDNQRRSTQVIETFARHLNHAPPSLRFVLRDAISDLPTLDAKTLRNATDVEDARWGFTVARQRVFDTPYARVVNGSAVHEFLFNHRSKYNNERDIEIYRRLKPGEGADAESIQDIMPYGSRRGIFLDKFFRLRMDRPSKTMTAHMYYDCHMYIHPTQARGGPHAA